MIITKQVFVSWASSNYTDNLHARAGIMCSQCHGKDIAKADDTVENSRCLTCHGPMDTLIMKLDANEFNDINPISLVWVLLLAHSAIRPMGSPKSTALVATEVSR